MIYSTTDSDGKNTDGKNILVSKERKDARKEKLRTIHRKKNPYRSDVRLKTKLSVGETDRPLNGGKKNALTILANRDSTMYLDILPCVCFQKVCNASVNV